jgi:hypothetical protein
LELFEAVPLLLTVCSVFILHVQLAETEVAESNVSSVVEKNILRLQVAVDDVETMQAFQSAQELSGVETSTIDVESLLLLQMMEQLATIDESQHKVELFW